MGGRSERTTSAQRVKRSGVGSPWASTRARATHRSDGWPGAFAARARPSLPDDRARRRSCPRRRRPRRARRTPAPRTRPDRAQRAAAAHGASTFQHRAADPPDAPDERLQIAPSPRVESSDHLSGRVLGSSTSLPATATILALRRARTRASCAAFWLAPRARVRTISTCTCPAQAMRRDAGGGERLVARIANGDHDVSARAARRRQSIRKSPLVPAHGRTRACPPAPRALRVPSDARASRAVASAVPDGADRSRPTARRSSCLPPRPRNGMRKRTRTRG